MQAQSFWKAVTMDQVNFLDELIALLAEHDIRYCVVGGQAVNAYVEPLVSLDLDLVVAVNQREMVEALLRGRFEVQEFPHSLNVSAPGSDLRVQIQKDARYAGFAERATPRTLLGVEVSVARVEDVLQGKIWAAMDPQRRPSKRRKDLLDIERLLERYPGLRAQVPVEILERLARD